jgi:hypothetical protein
VGPDVMPALEGAPPELVPPTEIGGLPPPPRPEVTGITAIPPVPPDVPSRPLDPSSLPQPSELALARQRANTPRPSRREERGRIREEGGKGIREAIG